MMMTMMKKKRKKVPKAREAGMSNLEEAKIHLEKDKKKVKEEGVA